MAFRTFCVLLFIGALHYYTIHCTINSVWCARARRRVVQIGIRQLIRMPGTPTEKELEGRRQWTQENPKSGREQGQRKKGSRILPVHCTEKIPTDNKSQKKLRQEELEKLKKGENEEGQQDCRKRLSRTINFSSVPALPERLNIVTREIWWKLWTKPHQLRGLRAQ